MSGTASEPRLRSTRRAASVRPVALAILFARGSVPRHRSRVRPGGRRCRQASRRPRGRLPGGDEPYLAAGHAVAHPVTPYVTRAEAGYAAYELLFAVLLVVVAAVPLRRGERWAWWCCWALVLAFAAFATLFGVHNSADLGAAIVAGLLVAWALIALRPTGRAGRAAAPAEPPSPIERVSGPA